MQNITDTLSQPEAVLAQTSTTQPGDMLRVVTHNGPFHADDVFACVTLILALDLPWQSIVRSRDPEVLARATLKVDVGGAHDPSRGYFDHHQRGGAGTRSNGTPYAAFGLIWREYGLQAVREALYSAVSGGRLQGLSDGVDYQKVMARVDAVLVEAVDAVDTGFASGAGYSVSLAIAGCNPGWLSGPNYTESDGFDAALKLAYVILQGAVVRAYEEELAEVQVLRCANSPIGDDRVILLDRFYPWQETVVTHCPETELVAFPAENGEWRLQVVPVAVGSFQARRQLPEAWGGLRAEELQTLTGVADAVFCHPGRFICGAKSREGILWLVRKALEA